MKILLLTFFTALAASSVQQPDVVPVTPISPKRVINLREVIQRDIGLRADQVPEKQCSYASCAAVSQANGRWAAMLSISHSETAIISGTQNGTLRAIAIPGQFRSMKLTADAHIHLMPSKDPSTICVMDLTGNLVNNYPVDSDEAPPPGEFLSALGSGFFTFDFVTETITLHRHDASIEKAYDAPLDAAYRAIGLSYPKIGSIGGNERVLWSDASPDGLLYVALSGTPASGPISIAVIDVKLGILRKVIRADLPAVQSPNGTMMPFAGAFGDQLVIADLNSGILAVY